MQYGDEREVRLDEEGPPILPDDPEVEDPETRWRSYRSDDDRLLEERPPHWG